MVIGTFRRSAHCIKACPERSRRDGFLPKSSPFDQRLSIYGSSVVGRASLPAFLRLRTALMAGRDARPTEQKLSILNKSTVSDQGEIREREQASETFSAAG